MRKNIKTGRIPSPYKSAEHALAVGTEFLHDQGLYLRHGQLLKLGLLPGRQGVYFHCPGQDRQSAIGGYDTDIISMLLHPTLSSQNIGYANLTSRLSGLNARLRMNPNPTANTVIRVRRANLIVDNGRGGFRSVIDQDHARPHQAERCH